MASAHLTVPEDSIDPPHLLPLVIGVEGVPRYVAAGTLEPHQSTGGAHGSLCECGDRSIKRQDGSGWWLFAPGDELNQLTRIPASKCGQCGHWRRSPTWNNGGPEK